MFNLGIGEIALIAVVLIIVVGPERLPTLMRTVGKSLRTLRQASRDIRTTVGLDELMREDVLRTPPRPRPRLAAAPEPGEERDAAQAVSAAEGDPGPIAREDAVEPPPPAGAKPPLAAVPSAAVEPPGPRPAQPVQPPPGGAPEPPVSDTGGAPSGGEKG